MKRKKIGQGLAIGLAGAMLLSLFPTGETVHAAEPEPLVITTEKDVYVQGGTDADKVMNGNQIMVKTPEKASIGSKYHRKGLVEFDLTGVPQEYNTAVLKLHVTYFGKQYNDTDCMDVYTTEAGWNPEMTWNTMPERKEKAASAYKANIDEENVMSIDVSDAVQAALKAGEKAISMELSFPIPQGGDHALYFSRHITEGQGPALELSYDAEKAQYDTYFENLRKKWHDYIVGSELDLNDASVQKYVASVNKTANKYWEEMNKSDETDRKQLWDSHPITVYTNTSAEARVSSGNVSTNFQRLKHLALAYETAGCDLYKNETLLQEIISGLDFMVDTYYNGSTSTDWGNWYHWEIGNAQALAATLMILQDNLTKEQMNHYMTGLDRYAGNCGSAGIPGSPTMTGANLLDKALVVAQTGVLTNNVSKMEHVKNAQKSVYTYVTKDDGFYADGSFIQHHTLAYTAGYGATLYGGIGVFFYMLDGTPWAIQYEDGSEQMIYDTIFNSIEPLMYDMQMADSTAGRGIVRSTADTRTRAVGVLNAILPIGASMKGEMKARFDSFAKDFIQTDVDYYFENTGNITTIQLAKKLLNDSSIAPRDNYAVHKTYAGMDRISHVRPEYMFNVAMSSTRQSKFENYNGEGLKTWNIADGMTYLYTDDLNQYTNGYWAAIDPHRLPGTTVERALSRKDFTTYAESGRTPYSWAGGVTLGNYGAAGVQMKSLGNENKGNGSQLTGADSKKSWFMFDDEIVAVGSSVTSTTGNCVETIIDNRQIKEDLSNEVTINGTAQNIVDNSDNADKHGTEIENAQWAHIQGNTENSSIGYYFPKENTTIHALKELRESNYSTQSTTEDKEVSGGYATLWFDHGAKPEGASYEYVILPGATADATKAYAKESQVEVLANDDNVHAVHHKSLDMTGVNFWNDSENTVAGITSNKKASVMMQKTKDGVLEIAVSDPTQENNGTIELTVDVPCEEVISQDETVTVNEIGDVVKLSVNVSGSMGASHTVKLQMVMPVDKEGLKSAIESAKAQDQTKYTEESWNALTAVIEEAEAVMENAEADQDTVNAMEEKVLNAIEALELKPEPEPQPDPKPEPKPEPQPDPTPDKKPDTKPNTKPESEPTGNATGAVQTGDTANVMLWAALVLAGCAGIVSAMLIRRKR